MIKEIVWQFILASRVGLEVFVGLVYPSKKGSEQAFVEAQ